MNWHIGQKVVCIKDGMHSRAGSIYTIQDFAKCDCTTHLRLVEAPNKGRSWCPDCSHPLGDGCWSKASRFRPLAEADLSAELAETFLKGQPPSEQEVYNPQYA